MMRSLFLSTVLAIGCCVVPASAQTAPESDARGIELAKPITYASKPEDAARYIDWFLIRFKATASTVGYTSESQTFTATAPNVETRECVTTIGSGKRPLRFQWRHVSFNYERGQDQMMSVVMFNGEQRIVASHVPPETFQTLRMAAGSYIGVCNA